MFNPYSILGCACGVICIAVAVTVSGLLPGAAAYLTLMAGCWFGIAGYANYSAS